MRFTARLTSLMCVLFLLLPLFGAGAEEIEARDLREDCKYTTSGGKFKITRLYDGRYNTTWKSYQQRHPFIEVKAPSGEKICGVYLCFGEDVRPFENRDAAGDTVYTSESLYAHQYVPLDGTEEITIRLTEDRQRVLEVSEIHVFTQGTVPDWVQQWQPTLEKADLMVLVAHPDDEILFFGGAIPRYAAEEKKAVIVATMTCGTYERRSELLDGLWYAGIRNYPVLGDFWDKYSKNIDTAYKNWGKSKVDKYIVSLLRTYRPEVVLTHDSNGEYGHGAHKICADAARRCFDRAADPDYAPETGEAWQVKKLYLHLYREGQIEMDWDQPLEAFGGMTGFEVAQEMYRHHISQQDKGQKVNGKFQVFVVEPRDSAYSCYRFGLVKSVVGEDVEKNDFFENVP